MSLQKASLMSSLDALSLSMKVRRLLARFTVSETERVWFIGLDVSLGLVSVVVCPSSETRVLLTASRTIRDGVVSYVTEEQSTSK